MADSRHAERARESVRYSYVGFLAHSIIPRIHGHHWHRRLNHGLTCHDHWLTYHHHGRQRRRAHHVMACGPGPTHTSCSPDGNGCRIHRLDRGVRQFSFGHTQHTLNFFNFCEMALLEQMYFMSQIMPCRRVSSIGDAILVGVGVKVQKLRNGFVSRVLENAQNERNDLNQDRDKERPQHSVQREHIFVSTRGILDSARRLRETLHPHFLSSDEILKLASRFESTEGVGEGLNEGVTDGHRYWHRED
mmetsp:Transcript_29045/g.24390  ORF Transcript_29045/g.24390 Transcript_29045/m.24390 type:complete len:247 (+) Transcript_29045:288-1028(+)